MDVKMMLVRYVGIVGLEGVPSGHLYAAMVGGVSLEQRMLLLSLLEKTGMLKVSNRYCKLTTEGLALLDRLNAVLARN